MIEAIIAWWRRIRDRCPACGGRTFYWVPYIVDGTLNRSCYDCEWGDGGHNPREVYR